MRDLLRDLKYAIRTLAKSPAFAAVAIASLALGIGANTAIFTLTDQLLLRQLPVQDPQQLVLLSGQGSHYGNNTGRNSFSYPMYTDIRDKNQVFSGIFCRWATELSFSAEGKTDHISAELVSGNYFPVLGIGPALGRVFTANDDLTQSGNPYAVLSYGFWQAHFGGRTDIIGKKILVENYPLTIIGVSQKGFDGIDPSLSPQIRIPMTMKKEMTPGPWFPLWDRRSHFAQIFARLKPGVTPTQAKASLQPLYHNVLNQEVAGKEFAKASDYSRQQFLKGWIDVLPGARGRSFLREQFEKPLFVLMCVVGAVLLIACANLAGLLVARAAARQKEIAIRLAMGASRSRIVRQLLVESLLLSVTGGITGLLLAMGMTHLLIGFIPEGTTPLALSSTPDWRILTFDLAVSLFAGVLFGLVPALQSTRPDLATTLKDQASAVVGAGAVGLRKALVTAQVALSLLLLIGAGLFVGTLRNLKNTNPGFTTDRLLMFRVDPPGNGYSDERTSQFYRDLIERTDALPGVRGAATAVVALLDGDEWDSSIAIEGYEAKPGENVGPHMNFITPEFFPVVGVPVLLGRSFNQNDTAKAAKVAIVNQKFVKRFFGEANPIGRRIGMGGNPGTVTDITIVGMVQDTKYEGVREDIPIELYRPYEQSGFASGENVYVRTDRDPEQEFAALGQLVHAMDAGLPVFDMRTLNEQVDRSLSTERLVATLSSAFGFLATFLAAIGLYGVMAYSVTRRTREIGIRMALGARGHSVIWMLMSEVLLLAAIGIAVGVPAAWMLGGKMVESQLSCVAGRDLSTIVGRGFHDRGNRRISRLRTRPPRRPHPSDGGPAMGVDNLHPVDVGYLHAIKKSGHPAGHVRPAYPDHAEVGTAARLRAKPRDPRQLGRLPSGGNRITLSGSPSPRTPGLGSVGMEANRGQSASQVLPPDGNRKETSHSGAIQMAAVSNRNGRSPEPTSKGNPMMWGRQSCLQPAFQPAPQAQAS